MCGAFSVLRTATMLYVICVGGLRYCGHTEYDEGMLFFFF